MWWVLIAFVVVTISLILFGKRGPRIGTASLMKEPHQLDTWIKYHKKIGVSKMYIYWDDLENDPPSNGDIQVFVLTPEFLKSIGYEEDPSWDVPHQVMAKQGALVNHALSQPETDWIFHIDSDELLYPGDRETLCDLMGTLDEDVDTCVINNYELAPDHENYKNCFVEGTKFRRGAHMVAYGNGKPCGRSGVSEAFGPHRCSSKRGGREYQFPDDKLKLLHYASCNLEEYMKKYKQNGKFSDDIWGWAEHHRKSRDVLTTCTSKESCTAQARDMFLETRPPKEHEQVIELKLDIDKNE